MKTAITGYILASCGITLVLIFSVFQMNSRTEADRIQQLKTTSIEMQRFGSQIVENEVGRWSSALGEVVSGSEVNNTVLAWGTLKESKARQNQFEIDQFKTANSGIEEKFLAKEIANVELEDVAKNDSYWIRAMGEDHRIYFLFIEKVQIQYLSQLRDKYIFGLIPGDTFTKLNLVSKGLPDLFFVVNNLGFTVSYPDAQYVGSKFENHPIVESIVQGQGFELSPEVVNISGVETIGGYLRVEGTNLYVVTGSPIWPSQQPRLIFLSEVSLVYLLVLGVLGALFFWLGKASEKKARVMSKNYELMVHQLGQLPVQATQKLNSDDAVEKSNQSEGFRRFASKLAQLLREPTTALIGYLQVLESKNKTGDTHEKISKALSEARKIKELLEITETSNSPVKTTDERIHLTALLNDLMARKRTQYIESGIAIQAEIQPNIFVRGQTGDMSWIVESLLKFLFDRVDLNIDRKNIFVGLKRISYLAEIKVYANYIQLNEQEKKNFFLPFQIQSNKGENLALELALMRKLIKDVGGEISLTKTNVENFELIILWPALEDSLEETQLIEGGA